MLSDEIYFALGKILPIEICEIICPMVNRAYIKDNLKFPVLNRVRCGEIYPFWRTCFNQNSHYWFVISIWGNYPTPPMYIRRIEGECTFRYVVLDKNGCRHIASFIDQITYVF